LHLRKPDALHRSWALLLAAIILYIPANVLPVMRLEMLGTVDNSTILGGVVLLAHEGMWPLALLIFFASVFIPMLKMLILGGLLTSVGRGWVWSHLDRSRLYRLTVFIGRWSMVDIFVVAILAALVQFQMLATITAGMGATFFALVVILTALAAESFDARLIWDQMKEKNHD
jgi:paraquat-inducible protein A